MSEDRHAQSSASTPAPLYDADIPTPTPAERARTLAVRIPTRTLVNNAGIEMPAAFWDVTEKDFDAVIHVNLERVFVATQAFVPQCLVVTFVASLRWKVKSILPQTAA